MQRLFASIMMAKSDRRVLLRKSEAILLLVLLAGALGVRPANAVAYLHILSAEPNGSGATISSQIVLVFDQAIDLDTFAGSINSLAILPSQVSADGSGTVIPVNPGTLTFGQTYNVIIDHTVATPGPDPLTLESDYNFSFTVDGTQPPPLPSSFHGEIHFSDSPPSTSNTVDILAPGVSGNTAVAAITLVDPNLVYQVNVRGDIPDTPAKEGGVENDLLTFLVDGRIAAKAYWHSGTSVLLNLHPPEALPGDPYTGNEGSAILFHGSANDWGNDPLTYQWDFNNDGLFDASGQDVSWTWMDNGTPTVLLKVTDAQGGEGTATVVVTVNNVAPTATLNAPNVNEGSDILLSLTSPYDPGSADTSAGFTYNFDCGSGYIGWSSTSTTSCPTTDKGTRSVKGKIKDKDGGVTEYTATVTINDVLPTNVNAGGVYTGISGQAVALAGSATCIPMDYCTYAWDLDGDGIYDDASGATPSYTWFTTGDFTILLQVTDNDGNTVTSPPASVHIDLATCSIPLVVGWNLVSCNIHPASTDPADVLADIVDKYDLVYAWDATGSQSSNGNWLKYAPADPPFANSLTDLNEKMGFWINATEEVTLHISGSAPATTAVSLWDNVGGWNLVGYPSVASRSLPEALSDHGVGDTFTLIYAYHANDTMDHWKLFDPGAGPYANDLTTMTPGWGYWVDVSADSTWTVNYLAP
jgi:hypothetical protein